MALIHTQPSNYIIRTLVRPFKKILPKSFYFAIDGTIKIKLTEGKQMIFTGNPTSNLLRVLFWNGYKGFEPHEYNIFVELAKQSKCIFDVGANMGYYSILAKIFNPKVEVHGFEPFPAARLYFEKNARLNNCSDIKIQEVALSENTGTASFFANRNPRFKNLENHLFGDNSLDKNFTGKSYEQIEIKVKTDTLDNYVAKNLKSGEKIDFLKMDTEGTENLVLRGSSNVLSEHQPIIMCEVVKGFVEEEVEQILKKFNYRFFRVNERGLVPTESLTGHHGKEDYFVATDKYIFRLKQFII